MLIRLMKAEPKYAQNCTKRYHSQACNSYNKTNWMHYFLKCIFGIKLYMFHTVLLSIIRSFFHCTHSYGVCHTGLLTACGQEQDRNAVPSWSCSQAVWHIPLLFVKRKTPHDGKRNCPKHVNLYSKNKFEKLEHLVGFIIGTYHDAPSPERQTKKACNW